MGFNHTQSTAMKQKRALLHQKASVKDHGKNLYDAFIFY
jgi:hypothetical protein